MAGGAVVRRCDMPGRLTGRLHAVVAGFAARVGRGVIHDRADIEATRCMAGIALGDGDDMGEVFAARGLTVVATVALFRKALEYTVAMAGFARNQLVAANQRKAGGQVIEFVGRLNQPCLCGIGRAKKREHKQHARSKTMKYAG